MPRVLESKLRILTGGVRRNQKLAQSEVGAIRSWRNREEVRQQALGWRKPRQRVIQRIFRSIPSDQLQM